MNPGTAPSRRARGFSLVEVVLAIGIVSFALLSILGLFGGTLKNANDNTERRELAEATDALRRTLQTTNFATAYEWARTGKSLLYVSYRAAANGGPDASSQTSAGIWLDPGAPPNPLSSYETARSGRWVRAALRVSASNPGGTNLPASAAAYPGGTVYVLAALDTLPTPDTNAPANSGTLEATLSVLR